MKIKSKSLTYPLIQGGMGVGVSFGNLAGNVAKCGGIGVISTANTGFLEPDFHENPLVANVRGLQQEIATAKRIANGNGLIGINAMVATVQYEEMVKTAVASGIDCIISGAGLPLQLPSYTGGRDVLLAPIVSSGRAATTICRYWDRKYKVIPDFIVIEGPRAGGHLGFQAEDLIDSTANDLPILLEEVRMAIKPYEEQYDISIPIFVAGSVNTVSRIEALLSLGADGVQIATRFIATHECDATLGFKEQYIKATNEDAIIVKSPVGMPARALNTPFLRRLSDEGRIAPTYCVNCIHTCTPSITPYCITNALIQAHQGNYEEGLFFCDDDLDTITTLTTVEALMEELTQPWRN
ncbi:MAG: nitronate monooxygenase [Eubacteriales bacterium]